MRISGAVVSVWYSRIITQGRVWHYRAAMLDFTGVFPLLLWGEYSAGAIQLLNVLWISHFCTGPSTQQPSCSREAHSKLQTVRILFGEHDRKEKPLTLDTQLEGSSEGLQDLL